MNLAPDTNLTNPVILNLFQDPFFRTRRSMDHGAVQAARDGAHRRRAPGVVAQWILKQVQDDDNGYGIV